MGKANLIIVALGLGACLVMAMFMRHALDVKQQQGIDPVVKEVDEVFGSRLRGRSEFVIENRDNRPTAVLTIQAKFTASRHLSLTLGDYVWRQFGDSGRFRALEIVSRGRHDEADRHYSIPAPLLGK